MSTENAETTKTVEEKTDIEQNDKIISMLAYLGILFFLPLVATPDSKFGRFHANQGLVLLIANFASTIVAIVPIIGWILAPIAGIFFFICMILGMVNAFKGLEKPLPLIGGITIIKQDK